MRRMVDTKECIELMEKSIVKQRRISGIIIRKPKDIAKAGKTLVIGMVALPFIKFDKYKVQNKSQSKPRRRKFNIRW